VAANGDRISWRTKMSDACPAKESLGDDHGNFQSDRGESADLSPAQHASHRSLANGSLWRVRGFPGNARAGIEIAGGGVSRPGGVSHGHAADNQARPVTLFAAFPYKARLRIAS